MNFRNPKCRASALIVLGLIAFHEPQAQNRELGGSGELVEGIAAVVDEGVVLLSELELHTMQQMMRIQQEQAALPPEQRSRLPTMSELEDLVLDQLILRRIKIQRAERQGLSISDDQLNQVIAQVAENNGIPFDQFPAAVEASGVDYGTFREDQRNELKVEILHRGVAQEIGFTEEELERCLEDLEASETDSYDYNVSHILIAVPGSPTAGQIREAEDEVDELLSRLEDGEDFSLLARTMSDAGTALDGGSLGWLKGAQLPSIFAETVLQMQPGEVSAPIRNSSGFHIVRLNDMRGAEPLLEDQVRARHILIVPNEIYDDEATRQRLLQIRQLIIDGDDFATHARQTSEDTASGAEGGDLGFAPPDVYWPEFAEQLRTLEIGELSEPVRTQDGWHLIEVLDRRRFDTTSDRMRQACIENIRLSKFNEELLIWEQQIRAMAYIEKKI